MKFRYILAAIAAALLFACNPSALDPETNKPGGDDNPGGGDNQGFSPELIYAETFDADFSVTSSNAKWLNNMGGSFSNAKGKGANGVKYSGNYAQVRKDNYGSTGNNGTYEDASGKCYVKLLTNSDNRGYMMVSGISTCGYKNFSLSIGVTQATSIMKLEASPDGKVWTELVYNFAGEYNKWERVNLLFRTDPGVTVLSLRFTITVPQEEANYGANLDDITIETVESAAGGTLITSKEKAPWVTQYAELPVQEDNPDWYYGTLYSTSVKTQTPVRNYSFCYDTRRCNPIWVAFPMHAIYTEGGSGRTDPDPWAPYPELPDNKQSIIWDITGDGLHQYWSYSNPLGDGGIWSKGHLCMSSSRGGAGSELNVQTFYAVNISPQKNSGSFAKLWNDTESTHWTRGTEICSDTLYVVCGCYYGNDSWTEFDATNWGDKCEYSKQVVIPTHHFKILLRTRSGYTGKDVRECASTELKAVGFWFDTIIPDSASQDVKDYMKSIADIEQLTGYTFFPDIPAEVKQQCNPSDWTIESRYE